jgi:repressor LexA
LIAEDDLSFTLTPQSNLSSIVVPFVDDNLATLKRFYKEGDRVVLKPANASMQPIYPNTIKIQGKVVGLVRKYI